MQSHHVKRDGDRVYAFAMYLTPGTRLAGGFTVFAVTVERPDVVIDWTHDDGTEGQTVRDILTEIDLDPVAVTA